MVEVIHAALGVLNSARFKNIITLSRSYQGPANVRLKRDGMDPEEGVVLIAQVAQDPKSLLTIFGIC